MSYDTQLNGGVSHDAAQVEQSPFGDDVDRIAPASEQPPRDERSENRQDDESGAEDQLMSGNAKQDSKTHEVPAKPLLRYRRTSVWLLACYLPFLILPWILTNIMAYRPPSLLSYYIQRYEHCESRADTILFWFAFVRILNSIASVLVVPITSALLAHGAVVYTQRRQDKQELHLRQLFALSDRSWSDIPTLWHAWRNRGRVGGMTSGYLKAATCLLLLGVVVTPLEQALIRYDATAVMTCADHPFSSPPVIGFDPEPGALAYTPQNIIIPNLKASLATVTDFDTQAYLWPEGSDWSLAEISSYNNFYGASFWTPYSFVYPSGQSPRDLRYHVTAFPNNTNTGILREHVMRLNSSAACETIDKIAFPRPCGGADPLVASYKESGISIYVCVPGNVSASPWSLSRDRQDISENLYISLNIDYSTARDWGPTSVDGPPRNFTVHCTANTTRGYFELPNWSNDFTPGPLLNKWPDKKTLENEFNDYLNNEDFPYDVPTTIDSTSAMEASDGAWHFLPDVYRSIGYRPMPGPLTASSIAMFGQESFFYIASKSAASNDSSSAKKQICQAGNIPFLRLNMGASLIYQDVFHACTWIEDPQIHGRGELGYMLASWIKPFDSDNHAISALVSGAPYAKEMLEVAMYFANLHWLLETSSATGLLGSARNIWSSPGLGIAKPVVSLSAKVIVSLSIACQVLGLGMLLRYIYSVPTWTAKLDSCAVAQLTHDVDSDVFSSIWKLDENELRELRFCNGLVGIAEENEKPPAGARLDTQDAVHAAEVPDPTRAHSSHSREDNDIAAAVSEEESNKAPILVRGGTGIITKDLAGWNEWKLEPSSWWPRMKRRRAIKKSNRPELEKGPIIDPARRARLARSK